MSVKKRAIWVFGDYRNYFQNRATLQLQAGILQTPAQAVAELGGGGLREGQHQQLRQEQAFLDQEA